MPSQIRRFTCLAGLMARALALAAPVLAIVSWAGLTSATESQIRPERHGFEVRTHADDPVLDERTVEISYQGIIDYPMAENLAAIWADIRGQYDVIVLRLDSHGGELGHTVKVISILKQIRSEAFLETLVYHGDSCYSACVLVFMQGERRVAGGASAWTFHGLCPRHTNVPVPDATSRFVELLRDAGASETFLCSVLEERRLSRPGQFWFSGYELFHVQHAGIITDLLDSWQPETPAPPSFDPQIGPQ